MAMLDPVWGIIWVVGVFAMLWIGATAGAPFKQRAEARQKLADLIGPDSRVNLEVGGRLYRDLLSGYGMADGVKLFDSMASPHPHQPTASPVANAFRGIVEEAINEGMMEVWGIPENGSKREQITHVEDDMGAHRKSLDEGQFFLMMDGAYYRDLRIKRSTIKSYVEHVRRHDAELYSQSKAEFQIDQPPLRTQ
ncbi:hypothetical protein A9Q95_04810 [Rhodobacterales bacterium 59_46_T64]|nr:hypothetical protein A9Q95_04810 [Rhodobacterales bacterium 59_46_T64]